MIANVSCSDAISLMPQLLCNTDQLQHLVLNDTFLPDETTVSTSEEHIALGMGLFSYGNKRNRRFFKRYWKIAKASELSPSDGCPYVGHVDEFSKVDWYDLGDIQILVRYGRIFSTLDVSYPHSEILGLLCSTISLYLIKSDDQEIYLNPEGRFKVENVHECHHRWTKQTDFSVNSQTDSLKTVGVGEVAVYNESLVELVVELATVFHATATLEYGYGVKFNGSTNQLRVMLFKRAPSSEPALRVQSSITATPLSTGCCGDREKRDVAKKISGNEIGLFFSMELISNQSFSDGEIVEIPVPYSWTELRQPGHAVFFYHSLTPRQSARIFEQARRHRAEQVLEQERRRERNSAKQGKGKKPQDNGAST